MEATPTGVRGGKRWVGSLGGMLAFLRAQKAMGSGDPSFRILTAYLRDCHNKHSKNGAISMKTAHGVFARGCLLMCALAAIVCGCACSGSRSDTKSQIRRFMISHISGDALGTVAVLEALREGEVEEVIRVLESSLDSYLTILTLTNKSWQKFTQDESVKAVIEEIQRYRSQYPRAD